MISGRTRVFALLGDPVAHSLSPVMQNAAFRVLGLDAAYIALKCAADQVASLATALAAAGGGGNATIPHKGVLAAALARPSASVGTIGGANTFWGEGGALAGDNTDIAGILDALALLDVPGSAWRVIGTGGSARAVAAAAAERGAALAVRSRDETRAARFSEWAAGLGVTAADPSACEVLINATPLGLQGGDALPVRPQDHPRAKWALDLVYAPGATPWVRSAVRAGLRAQDGREVLVGQGRLALELWFPGTRAPVDVMRAAVQRALA
ncbi:MAG: shikimate dehydrogenase family protein [Gemmatimonadales bacterium]